MAFKMRSGNGPLAFKNMGSSPAKADLSKLRQGTRERVDEYARLNWEQDHTTTKHKDYKANNKKIAPLGVKPLDVKLDDKPIEATKTFKETSAEIKKEKKAHTDSKHKGQLKKEARLKKITDRREAKGKKGLTTRQMNLKRRVDQTAEEYVEENREGMRRTVAGLREYGPGGSGSQTEGKAKYDAGKIAQSNREKTQASQDIRDARTKQLTEQAKMATNEETTLNSDTQNAIGADGVNLNSNTTEYVSSSDKAVQRQKDLNKQIADDKAKMEKELGINQE